MKNYTIFTSRFIEVAFTKGTEHFYSGDPKITVGLDALWVERILKSFKTVKIFEITDELKKLLLLTKPPKDIHESVHFPYVTNFIDVCFTQEEIKRLLGKDIPYSVINGVLITERSMKVSKKDPIEDGIVDLPIEGNEGMSIGRAYSYDIYCDEFVNGDLYHTFKTFHADMEIDEDWKPRISYKPGFVDKTTRELLHNFALNFLHFIQDKDVWLVQKAPDRKRNEKRIKKGKVPIPQRMVINLKGELKLYMRKVVRDKKLFHYSHRFWVMGHWRTYRHEKWGDKVGTSIWISPFIKGKGLLVDRRYRLEDGK